MKENRVHWTLIDALLMSLLKIMMTYQDFVGAALTRPLLTGWGWVRVLYTPSGAPNLVDSNNNSNNDNKY